MALRPESTVGATDPMVPHVARVRGRRRDGPQVWTIEISDDEGDGGGFVPGQFNMLTAFGVGEAPISLSGHPEQTDRLVHTIRAVGAVSTALTQLRPGQALGLRGPFGVGWPLAEAAGRDVVLIAGGLGLAPLRPVLYALISDRPRYGNISLLYGTRSPDNILFRRELESWRRRLDLDIEVTVDHAVTDWHGHIGVVTSLIPHCAFDPTQTIAMVCGPEIMMRFVIAALGDAGVPENAIYLSMERSMKCAIGFCGRCQFGPSFVCRDGPVFRYDRLHGLLGIKEI